MEEIMLPVVREMFIRSNVGDLLSTLEWILTAKVCPNLIPYAFYKESKF